jgi:hypothetical protein
LLQTGKQEEDKKHSSRAEPNFPHSPILALTGCKLMLGCVKRSVEVGPKMEMGKEGVYMKINQILLTNQDEYMFLTA